MYRVTMTPPDAHGDVIIWNRTDVENGVILAPDSCPEGPLRALQDFASGTPVGLPSTAEELTAGDTDVLAAKVFSSGELAHRFYADRFREHCNETYPSWLCSNLMLSKALQDRPRYTSVLGGENGFTNIRVEPVEYLGSSIRTLPSGLVSTLTIMSRAPGHQVASSLIGEDSGDLGRPILGRPEAVFLEVVSACVVMSLWEVYPSYAGLMFVDGHERNVIVDEVQKRVAILDVHGLASPLDRVLGRQAGGLAELDSFTL